MCLFWSLKGKGKFAGRAYWKTRSASIFLHVLFKDSKSFGEFIAAMTFIQFHEYLHLFFKFHLGKYHCSCKTKIDPLAQRLTNAMAEDPVFVERVVKDFIDLNSLFREA